MDRYAGKPFLRLLECYVLHSAGQLDENQNNTLQRMEPKLREIYGTGGPWMEIVRKQMAFPDTLPAKIQALWDGYVQQARRQGLEPDPNDFALRFVDENFPNL